MKQYKYLILLIGFCSTFISAQTRLSKDEAVGITLENNYDILVSTNNVRIAENNASIYNSGYLPNLFVNGNGSFQDSQRDSEFLDGSTFVSNINSEVLNGSVGVGYNLFDGFGRKYNYKRLKEQYNLSEVQAKLVIELSVLQLLQAYYEVARLTQNKINQEISLGISKERLTREKYSYEFGQNTILDVLNSEVNVNNDSITILNTDRLLSNAKRDLNVIAGRDINIDFEVDTLVEYNLGLNLASLIGSAKKDNKALQQAEKNIELSNYDLKISKSTLYPSLDLSSSYSLNNTYNQTDVGNPFSLIRQNSKGIQAGVNLTWNIFDGGFTKTRIQNAKISIENNEILKKQIEQDLERNISNAWETYQNALYILQAEKKNVETNQRNFSRSEEQFKLGQIISIEFRLAQTNYLNAVTNYTLAKYSAKVAELVLLQLSGQLLGANY